MTTDSRRIDHLVLAVRDLDGAAAWYERLGFQVGVRNRHPWGTENRLVQLSSSFLELITVGDTSDIAPHAPGVFSFGAFVCDYLARREGLAMLVLDSADAVADAAAFGAAGIGAYAPFSFERSGRRPDGTPTRVAFSLAFAHDARLPEAGFFVCQQHVPEAFWSPALQQHANGAVDITRVTLGVDEPGAHVDFLERFTWTGPSDGRHFRFGNGGEIALADEPGTNRLTAFTVGVGDLEAVAARLRSSGIPFDQAADRITLPAEVGYGVRVEFGQR